MRWPAPRRARPSRWASDIAGRMIKQSREEKLCDGVHIMAIGKEAVPDILAAAGLNGA